MGGWYSKAAFAKAKVSVPKSYAELEQVNEQARKVRDQLEASYSDAADRGHVVAMPPAEAFIGSDDLAARTGGAPRLEELALEGGPEGPPLHQGTYRPNTSGM